MGKAINSVTLHLSKLLDDLLPTSTSRKIFINTVAGLIALAIILYVIEFVTGLILDQGVISGIFTGLANLDLQFFAFLDDAHQADVNSPFFEVSLETPRWQALLIGLSNTLIVVFIGIIFATLVGIVIGVSALSSNILVSRLSTIYVEIWRNVPLISIFFLLYFVVILELFPPLRESYDWGVIIISNNGLVVPGIVNKSWIISSLPSWLSYLWLGITLLSLVIALVVRSRLIKRTEKTGKPSYANRIAVGIFISTAIISYFALLAPFSIELPDVIRERFGSFEGGFLIDGILISVTVGLILYFSAFIAEIVRGSIQAVSYGQTEASNALGLSYYQKITLIILPQALRIMIPALNNEYQNTNKDATIGATIGYTGIIFVTRTIINKTGEGLSLFVIILAIFMILNLLISLFMNFLNRRYRLSEGK